MPPSSAFSDNFELERSIENAWKLLESTAEEHRFDPACVVEDISTTLSRRFYKTLVHLAARRNALQAVQKLPVEVLAHVFSSLGTKDRVVNMLVCKKWHHVLATSPHLWNVIWDTPWVATSPPALTKQLAISAPCLVSLSVVVNDSNLDTVCRMVQAAMHRLRVLCFNLQTKLLLPQPMTVVTNLLRTPAPHLTKFQVNDPYDIISSTRDGLVWFNWVYFGGQAPLLSVLVVETYFKVFRLSYGAFRAVKHLSLHVAEELSPEMLVSTFEEFVSLENLVLKVFEWDALVPDCIRLPRTLNTLVIDSTDCYCGATLCLSSLEWRHIRNVSFGQQSEFDDLDLMFEYFAGHSNDFTSSSGTRSDDSRRSFRTSWIECEYNSLGNYACASLRLYEDESEMHGLAPVWDRGRAPSRPVWERAISNVFGKIDPRLFVNITRLYISELVLDPKTMIYFELPPLPCVQHLTVRMIPSYFHQERGFGGSPFLLHQVDEILDAVRLLVCPQLQTLTIAAGHGEWTEAILPRLTVQMVLEFVFTHLRYDSEQLQSMTFIGLRLIVGEADEFEQLLKLAKVTDWDERFMDWAVNTEHQGVFDMP